VGRPVRPRPRSSPARRSPLLGRSRRTVTQSLHLPVRPMSLNRLLPPRPLPSHRRPPQITQQMLPRQLSCPLHLHRMHPRFLLRPSSRLALRLSAPPPTSRRSRSLLVQLLKPPRRHLLPAATSARCRSRLLVMAPRPSALASRSHRISVTFGFTSRGPCVRRPLVTRVAWSTSSVRSCSACSAGLFLSRPDPISPGPSLTFSKAATTQSGRAGWRSRGTG
jgi:hypothetical protein